MSIDQRHKLYLQGKTREDEIVDLILSSSDHPIKEIFKEVQSYRSRQIHRQYLEAGLLSISDENQLTELVDMLGMSEAVIRLYKDMYFDISFQDKLTKLELAEVCKNREEASLRLWCISLGPQFLAWRLGKKTDISPVEGLREIFNTCIFKSKEAIFNANASVASRESTKWVKLSIEVGKLLKTWVMDSSAAKQDLEIALKEVIPEFDSIEDLDGFDTSILVKNDLIEEETANSSD